MLQHPLSLRKATIVLAVVAALTGCVQLRTFGDGGGSPPPYPSPPAEATAPAITQGTHRVPDTIDATGASDASPALLRFIQGVPDGAIIEFPAGGTYRLDHGLQLWRRSDLIFDGNGATLVATGSPRRPGDSPFALMFQDERITIRDFVLRGQNPDAGTTDAFHGADEHLAGLYLGGATDIIVEDMTITDFYGDCLYVGANTSDVWSTRVLFQDSTCTRTGRHGVSVVAGRDVTVRQVAFDEIGFMIMDIEPDRPEDGAEAILVEGNTVGSYGLTDEYVSWLVAAHAGAEGAPVHDVAVIGNSITGVGRTGNDGVALGLSVVVDGRVGPRSGFVIRDNTSTRTVRRTAHGAPILIRRVTGVAVTGNRQPMDAGELAVFRGSTDVTYGANETTP